jgi:FixJ family two-component response regulator
MSGAPLIAVVDDDPLVREIHANILMETGFQTKAFETAEEFLSSLQHEKYDCIVLDMSMPGMSGYEMQCTLEERGVSIPIIFVTATVDVPAAMAAIKHGAVDIVQKPVDATAFVAQVRNVMRAGTFAAT